MTASSTTERAGTPGAGPDGPTMAAPAQYAAATLATAGTAARTGRHHAAVTVAPPTVT